MDEILGDYMIYVGLVVRSTLWLVMGCKDYSQSWIKMFLIEGGNVIMWCLRVKTRNLLQFGRNQFGEAWIMLIVWGRYRNKFFFSFGVSGWMKMILCEKGEGGVRFEYYNCLRFRYK